MATNPNFRTNGVFTNNKTCYVLPRRDWRDILIRLETRHDTATWDRPRREARVAIGGLRTALAGSAGRNWNDIDTDEGEPLAVLIGRSLDRRLADAMVAVAGNVSDLRLADEDVAAMVAAQKARARFRRRQQAD